MAVIEVAIALIGGTVTRNLIIPESHFRDGVNQLLTLAAGDTATAIDGTEITSQGGCGRHISDALWRIAALTGCLEAAKDEELIANDLIAQGAAKLVAFQRAQKLK